MHVITPFIDGFFFFFLFLFIRAELLESACPTRPQRINNFYRKSKIAVVIIHYTQSMQVFVYDGVDSASPSVFAPAPPPAVINIHYRRTGYQIHGQLYISSSLFMADWFSIPSHGGGAHYPLPEEQDSWPRISCSIYPWDWSLQVRALGTPW